MKITKADIFSAQKARLESGEHVSLAAIGAPVKLVLGVKDWENTPEIAVNELVCRLQRSFPGMTVDREKGNASVQTRLDQLTDLGAPKIILESHRGYFSNTIFESICEEVWNGAVAVSYLTNIWPPLGDALHFDVIGADSATFAIIKQDLQTALDMIYVPEPERGTA